MQSRIFLILFPILIFSACSSNNSNKVISQETIEPVEATKYKDFILSSYRPSKEDMEWIQTRVNIPLSEAREAYQTSYFMSGMDYILITFKPEKLQNIVKEYPLEKVSKEKIKDIFRVIVWEEQIDDNYFTFRNKENLETSIAFDLQYGNVLIAIASLGSDGGL